MNRALLTLLVISTVALILPVAAVLSVQPFPPMTVHCPMCHQVMSFGPVLGILVVIGAVGLGVTLAFVLAAPTQATKLVGLLDEESRVVDLLSSTGPMTQKEIARRLGISRVKAHRVIKQLERRGVVTTKPYGKTKLVKLRGTDA